MTGMASPPALDPAVVAVTGLAYPADDLAGRATPQRRRLTREDGTPY